MFFSILSLSTCRSERTFVITRAKKGLKSDLNDTKLTLICFIRLEALGLTPYPNENVCSNNAIAINVPAGVDNNEVRKIVKEKRKVFMIASEIVRASCLSYA